jgi:hypothetical protein
MNKSIISFLIVFLLSSFGITIFFGEPPLKELVIGTVWINIYYLFACLPLLFISYLLRSKTIDKRLLFIFIFLYLFSVLQVVIYSAIGQISFFSFLINLFKDWNSLNFFESTLYVSFTIGILVAMVFSKK